MGTVRIVAGGILVAAAFTSACGPSISEARMMALPARGSGCSLELVRVTYPELMNNTGPWELVGYVTVNERGVGDPLSPSARERVRPRACAMGGHAIAVMTQVTGEQAFHSSSGTSYAVLRPRQTEAAPAPQRF